MLCFDKLTGEYNTKKTQNFRFVGVKHLNTEHKKSQQACLGSNVFQLASHVVQGSLIFSGTESIYCKCSFSVLPSMYEL